MDARLDDALRTGQVRFLRICWCDNAGLLRAKAIHVPALDRFAEAGIGITRAQQALPAQGDTVITAAGLGPIGEIRLIPDWSTFTLLPYAPGHARVQGDMHLGDRPWPLCPRGFLRRMIAALAALGLEVRAAFENEFYLLRVGPDGPIPADDTVFAATWSMDLHHRIIDDLASALAAQGVEVEAYYPESGPGQQEVSILHTPAATAADQQMVFRETVRAVALRHGLRASFLPKLFAGSAGSGAHLHLSLWRNGQSITADPDGAGGLAPPARCFLAGLLDHLPALMAVTTPTPNSYRRLQPRCWAGAYRIWGLDNREAALRVLSGPRGSTHWELKTVDATCNPHLALGAVLACGLDGLHRGLDLSPTVNLDPGTLTPEELVSRGIEPLPANLGVALAHLYQDNVLAAAMGPALFQAFAAVRAAEWQALGGLSLEDEVRLLWERY